MVNYNQRPLDAYFTFIIGGFFLTFLMRLLYLWLHRPKEAVKKWTKNFDFEYIKIGLGLVLFCIILIGIKLYVLSTSTDFLRNVLLLTSLFFLWMYKLFSKFLLEAQKE